ncbi:MAG: CbiX/SirB N-terminal domain-containing protein [Betaproteobacteria bacterium]
MASRGVILFAHGARDPAWAEPFEALRDRFAALAADLPVRLAFLEFLPPDLADAARDLVASGCREITIVPAFLGVGGHVRRDVPGKIAEIEREHSGVKVTLARALGEDASVQDAMASAAVAAARD